MNDTKDSFITFQIFLKIVKYIIVNSQKKSIFRFFYNIFEVFTTCFFTLHYFCKKFFCSIYFSPRRVESPEKKFKKVINTGVESIYKTTILYLVDSSYYDSKGRVKKYFFNFNDAYYGTALLEALTPDSINGCSLMIRKIKDSSFLDFPYREILNNAKKNKNKVLVIFAGVTSAQYFRALNIALKLKSLAVKIGLKKKIDFVFGGCHIRGDKSSHKELNSFGFITADGEAESIYNSILIDAVNNQLSPIYKSNKLCSIKGYPFPYFPKKKFVLIQLSRGCPVGCKFCAVTNLEGKCIRTKSIGEIEVLINHLVDQKCTGFLISDNDFAKNPFAYDILDILISVQKNKNINFDIYIYTDLMILNQKNFNKKFMDKCKEANIKLVSVGIESVNLKILQKMNKAPNLAKDQNELFSKIKNIIEEWHKRGIGIMANFIIGNEEDKIGIGRFYANVSAKLDIDVIAVYPRSILPGSSEYLDCLSGKLNNVLQEYSINGTKRGCDIDGAIMYKNKKAILPSEVKNEIIETLENFYKIKNIKKIKCNLYTKKIYALSLISFWQNSLMHDLGMFRKNKVEKFNEKKYEENKKICCKYKMNENNSGI